MKDSIFRVFQFCLGLLVKWKQSQQAFHGGVFRFKLLLQTPSCHKQGYVVKMAPVKTNEAVASQECHSTTRQKSSSLCFCISIEVVYADLLFPRKLSRKMPTNATHKKVRVVRQKCSKKFFSFSSEVYVYFGTPRTLVLYRGHACG